MQPAVLDRAARAVAASLGCAVPQRPPGQGPRATPSLLCRSGRCSPARPLPAPYLFFLKKLNRFSRSFSLDSLFRSVKVPSGALLGETGGKLAARVIPLLIKGVCSSGGPCGVGAEAAAALITRIQVLISA